MSLLRCDAVSFARQRMSRSSTARHSQTKTFASPVRPRLRASRRPAGRLFGPGTGSLAARLAGTARASHNSAPPPAVRCCRWTCWAAFRARTLRPCAEAHVTVAVDSHGKDRGCGCVNLSCDDSDYLDSDSDTGLHRRDRIRQTTTTPTGPAPPT